MKKLSLLLISLFLLVSLYACGQASDSLPPVDNGTTITETSTADRKIIYQASLYLDVSSVTRAYDEIIALLNIDEWSDSESIGSTTATIVVRIKTTRLNDFIDQIRNDYVVTSFNKTATDVSLNYYDNEAQILILEAEQTRLIELFATANISDQIQISQRLSEIDVALRELNGELTQYDSLIEYSEVTIHLNGETPFDTLSLGNKIVRSLSNGWKAFTTVLEYILLAFLTLLPFIFIGIPIAYGIYKLASYINIKLTPRREASRIKHQERMKQIQQKIREQYKKNNEPKA